jgi:hypothetical protein
MEKTDWSTRRAVNGSERFRTGMDTTVTGRSGTQGVLEVDWMD